MSKEAQKNPICHNITLTVSGVRCSGKTRILQIIYKTLMNNGFTCRLECDAEAKKRIVQESKKIGPPEPIDPNYNFVVLKEERFE